MAGIYDHYQHYAVEPGSNERRQQRLEKLKEINEKRPCKKCVFYNPSYMSSCRCSYSCNFNHDYFKERD